jgi:hypothetical protein
MVADMIYSLIPVVLASSAGLLQRTPLAVDVDVCKVIVCDGKPHRKTFVKVTINKPKSMRHMPAAATLTKTSSQPTSGTGISSSRSGSQYPYIRAATHLHGASSVATSTNFPLPDP